MKKLAKTLFFSLMLAAAIFTTASASPSDPSARKSESRKSQVELKFVRGTEIEAGSTLVTKLVATGMADVDLKVVDRQGNLFGEKHIVLQDDAKLLGFKITNVPDGVYYVKVNHRGMVYTYPFLVK
ncbi:MAG: hypothetical protein U0176_11465 [Bacteroidia bacterium]